MNEVEVEVKCPVCFDWPMRTPIYQCDNGHALCRECEARVARCPVCTVRLPKDAKVRNYALEEQQPKNLMCSISGCQDSWSNQEDLDEHMENCQHRQIPMCKYLGIDDHCDSVFSPVEYEAAASHLRADHGDKAFIWYRERLDPDDPERLPEESEDSTDHLEDSFERNPESIVPEIQLQQLDTEVSSSSTPNTNVSPENEQKNLILTRNEEPTLTGQGESKGGGTTVRELCFLLKILGRKLFIFKFFLDNGTRWFSPYVLGHAGDGGDFTYYIRFKVTHPPHTSCGSKTGSARKRSYDIQGVVTSVGDPRNPSARIHAGNLGDKVEFKRCVIQNNSRGRLSLAMNRYNSRISSASSASSASSVSSASSTSSSSHNGSSTARDRCRGFCDEYCFENVFRCILLCRTCMYCSCNSDDDEESSETKTRQVSLGTNWCCICWSQPMKIPIYECTNGHVLCRECEEKVEICPVCRVSLSRDDKIRNFEIELEQPSPVFCGEIGCKEDFYNTEDLELHGRVCEWKKIAMCKNLGIDDECEEEFCPKEYEFAAVHLQELHPERTFLWTRRSFRKDQVREDVARDGGAENKLEDAFWTTRFLWCIREERLFVLKFLGREADFRVVPFVLAHTESRNEIKGQMTFKDTAATFSSQDGYALRENQCGLYSFRRPAVSASTGEAVRQLWVWGTFTIVGIQIFEVETGTSDTSSEPSDTTYTLSEGGVRERESISAHMESPARSESRSSESRCCSCLDRFLRSCLRRCC